MDSQLTRQHSAKRRTHQALNEAASARKRVYWWQGGNNTPVAAQNISGQGTFSAPKGSSVNKQSCSNLVRQAYAQEMLHPRISL